VSIAPEDPREPTDAEPASQATSDAPREATRDAPRPGDGDRAEKGRGPWQAIGAAALAFTLVTAVTSDFCAATESPLVGEEALPFTSPIVGGEGGDEGDRIVLDALRGRVVVLDFWASWCPPCRASIPALEEFSRAHPDVVVLGVNVESERRAPFVRAAHAELGATYPTVHDEDGTLQAAYRITGLPTLLVIDAEGRVRDAHVGAVNRGWLEAHAGSN
jgi:cytochrome c biogenesis protein CcmG/thiol:disulfide interchange protein DsbE